MQVDASGSDFCCCCCCCFAHTHTYGCIKSCVSAEVKKPHTLDLPYFEEKNTHTHKNNVPSPFGTQLQFSPSSLGSVTSTSLSFPLHRAATKAYGPGLDVTTYKAAPLQLCHGRSLSRFMSDFHSLFFSLVPRRAVNCA